MELIPGQKKVKSVFLKHKKSIFFHVDMVYGVPLQKGTPFNVNHLIITVKSGPLKSYKKKSNSKFTSG